jgi:hypothetical protein
LHRTSATEARNQCTPIVAQVTEARRYLEPLVGVGLSHGIELIILTDPINARNRVPAQSTSVRAGTVGCYASGTFDGDPDCGGLPADGALRLADWQCQIQISGDFRTAYDAASQRSALAHELFHCYQRERSGETVPTFNRTTPWLIEGSAAWIGETYARGSSISVGWWRAAVTASGVPQDACTGGAGGPPHGCVFGRPAGYSAHAFFFALAEAHGGDAAVVSSVLAAVNAGGDDAAAMAGLAGPTDPVWLHWAAFARNWRAAGPSWELRAPGNNADARPSWERALTLLSGPQVSLTAGLSENKIADVSWSSIRSGEQNMVVDLNGFTVARWMDGSGDPVGSEITTSGARSRLAFCITNRCTSGVDRPPRGAQKIVIAVAGTGAAPSTATVSLECPAPNASGVSRISGLGASPTPTKCCLVGDWQMSQAPIYANFNSISGGGGAILTIEPDGHLVQDYGPMTEWIVEDAARPELGRFHMKLDGQLVADIDLDKLVNQRRVRSLATEAGGVLVTASVEIPGSSERLDFGTQPFSEWFSLVVAIAGEPPEESTVDLTCSATTLRLTDSVSGITHEFTRLSEPVCGGSSCDVRRGDA